MPVVRTEDAEIAYRIEGSGDPLLMIMGLGADAQMWMFQTPAFAATHTCILPDNRGSGASTAPPGALTTAVMARDALAVLDDAGIERAHVLGISLGGAIAQHLAALAPDRVRSLILAATWAGPNPYTARIAGVGRVIAGLGREVLVRASLLWLFTPAFLIEQDEMVREIEAIALTTGVPPEAFEQQLDAVETHDARPHLRGLDVATRVIVATRDIMVPPELGREVASMIPGADTVEIPAGHALNIEAAPTFNEAVAGFIAGR